MQRTSLTCGWKTEEADICYFGSPCANTARSLGASTLMWGPATFVLGLLSLVQAQSSGQLTVCIVEAYNLENLDADEPFGGSASDPYAACCATSAPRSLIFDPTDGR